MLPKLQITPAADKFMRRIVRFSGLPEGAGFRLQVSEGGCSGYNAEFSAEPGPREGEQTLEAVLSGYRTATTPVAASPAVPVHVRMVLAREAR